RAQQSSRAPARSASRVLGIGGAAGVTAEKATGVWPPTVAWMAGAAPVNCTVGRSRSLAMRKISPDRCGVLPTPGAAKLYLPGLARITAINSCMVLAGTD